MGKGYAQLSPAREDDTADAFTANVEWAIWGYTRDELLTLAGGTPPANPGDRTELLAKLAITALVPAYLGSAPLTRVVTTTAELVDNHFRFELEYSLGAASSAASSAETAAGGPGPSIRIATQTVNRQVANGDIRVYEKTGTTAPAAPKGILPDGKGNFRGADVVVPTLSWSEPHVVSAANFSLAKGKEIVGKTNAATFRGFAAGTVLCVGATADQRPSGLWDVVLDFQQSDELDDEPAPGFSDFENVTKGGWEFLFPLADESGEVLALCVAPLLDSIDFATVSTSLAEPA